MSKPIKISVVIRAFNSEKTLMRSVQSALLQSVAPAEIIVVESKGLDTTPLIVSELESSGFVTALKSVDAEDVAALNRAIHTATGDYVLFMGADQWLDNDLFKCINDHIENYQSGKGGDLIVINDIINCNMDTEKFILNDLTLPLFLDEIETSATIDKLDLKLYSTKVIRNSNVLFYVDLNGNEGLFFNLKFICNIDSALIIKVKIDRYGHNYISPMITPCFLTLTLQKEYYIFIMKILFGRFSSSVSPASKAWYVKRLVLLEMSIIISMFHGHRNSRTIRARIRQLRLPEEHNSALDLLTKKDRLKYRLLCTDSAFSYFAAYVLYVWVFSSR